MKQRYSRTQQTQLSASGKKNIHTIPSPGTVGSSISMTTPSKTGLIIAGLITEDDVGSAFSSGRSLLALFAFERCFSILLNLWLTAVN